MISDLNGSLGSRHFLHVINERTSLHKVHVDAIGEQIKEDDRKNNEVRLNLKEIKWLFSVYFPT